MQLIVNVPFVIDNPLQFAPATLPHAQVGVAYGPISIGTVSGGVSPYTFAATSGLPAGMSLSSAGVLSGTPTTAGQASISVTITDSGP